ncbi:MAG: endonuclease/exonuclease/phosphatase family protein [Acidobacteriota bacterium]|nr:endonuclease/exonuclease/phosphatase family protein [Acidobacteriota bacterium]
MSETARGRKWVDLRVATYNIHRCRGMDRRTDPARIAKVIQSTNADVVALQEVIGAGPNGTVNQAEEIGALAGMGWVMAPARELRGHLFGNVVMSRLPMTAHAHCDLTWRSCEHRNVQRVDVDVNGRVVHLFNVHLGTALLERRYQAGRLAAYVHDKRVEGPKIVVGDFNEWTKGLATTLLSQKLKALDLYPHLKRRRTYPGIFPFLHLDHVYYEGELEIQKVELVRTRLSLMASDHLPLVVELRILC